MPALITHHLFGESGIELLPDGIITTDDERTAFLIASQGPDPFFYRFRSLRMRDCQRLATSMHRCRMSRQLATMRAGVEDLLPREAGVGRAFALGQLAHYLLDRTAHPFVYAQQHAIQDMDESLARAGSSVHAIIEGDLDVLMLQLMRGQATVADAPPADELAITDHVGKVAGALMSFIARSVYDLSVDGTEYGGAVADMRLAYRIIEPAGSVRERALGALEGTVGSYPMLAALAHRVTREPPARAGNLEHRPWMDPFVGTRSPESFPEIFDRALRGYADAARRFIDGDTTEAITGHVNYSGRPLAADEEFEQRG